MTHVFGEKIMPSNRSRFRKITLLSKKYLPISGDKRKRSAPIKNTDKNTGYSRYKSSRLKPSDLIEQSLEKEHIYASCIDISGNKTGIYDTCCKKLLPLVFQNLMAHICTNVHKNAFDDKKETKRYVDGVFSEDCFFSTTT